MFINFVVLRGSLLYYLIPLHMFRKIEDKCWIVVINNGMQTKIYMAEDINFFKANRLK